jgi:rhodanese-related sulfurtransferase
MDQLIPFISEHPILVGGFAFVAVLLIQDIITNGFGKTSVDPKGATDLINNEDALVIDVRPEADFNKGHILNSLNVPLSRVSEQLEKLKKHQDRTIIVSCNSGGQSASACSTLRKAGFEKVFNLKGGILAWQSDNRPISRKKK